MKSSTCIFYTSPIFNPQTEHALPLSKHVLDLAPVVAINRCLQLVLVQPLEVLQPKRIVLEIGLAGHYTRLQEEGLGALLLQSGGGLDGGLVFELCVANGHVAHEPGVHVETAGLGDDALRGL